jgi:hypothetical protein
MSRALDILRRGRARFKQPAPPARTNDDIGLAVEAFNADHPILDVFSGRELTRTGKEYHGACPMCGGTDRFCVWPARGRAWCRQCNASGDALAWAMRLDGHDPATPGETARYLSAQGYLKPPETPQNRKPTPEATHNTPRLCRADIAAVLGRDPDAYELEFLAERAAVIEFDAGLRRHEAEHEALRCLLRLLEQEGRNHDRR